MDMSEMKQLHGDKSKLIVAARAVGFSGTTPAGAWRYLMHYHLPRVRPTWQGALRAEDRRSVVKAMLWAQDGEQPNLALPWSLPTLSRVEWETLRRFERMTAKHGDELRGRILYTHNNFGSKKKGVLPHPASSIESIAITDHAHVVKHAPKFRQARKGGTMPARLALHFPYRAIQYPFVGTIVDDAIIMDAEPAEEGYIVLYTANAAGAQVVLKRGFYISGSLYKTEDETKARRQALAGMLVGA